jgi:hypothetical protein
MTHYTRKGITNITCKDSNLNKKMNKKEQNIFLLNSEMINLAVALLHTLFDNLTNPKCHYAKSAKYIKPFTKPIIVLFNQRVRETN